MVPLLILGCRENREAERVTPDAASIAAKAPLDHVPNGELAAGSEKAFALPLPYNMKVIRRFEKSVVATGRATPEELAAFVRTRVRDGQAIVTTTGTRFERVKVPSDPERVLSITVDINSDESTRLAVDDVTPVKEERLAPTPQERMKAAGLTPDGRILDPKHFE